jgi:hypothetical protein
MKGLFVNRLLPRIGTRSPSRHFEGLPPELTAGVDERVTLAHPAILTIEESPRGQIFLDRYTLKGEPVGDTWHPTVEEAIEEAQYEYGEILGPWIEVPAGRDALEYAQGDADSERD